MYKVRDDEKRKEIKDKKKMGSGHMWKNKVTVPKPPKLSSGITRESKKIIH